MPRRPPRHPSSPSIRSSRSLELLDPMEKKVILTVAKNPQPLPRPRSRSLDGLIDDEDGIIANLKNNDNSTAIENSIINTKYHIKNQSLNEILESTNNSNENPFPLPRNRRTFSITQKSDIKAIDKSNKDEENLSNLIKIYNTEDKSEKLFFNISNDNLNQMTKMDIEKNPKELKNFPKSKNIEELDKFSKNSNQFEIIDLKKNSEQLENQLEININNIERLEKLSENSKINEKKLSKVENEKSTLLKAKSCGAGLDSDDNYSQEYKPVIKGQGSLLSLSTGADPKRKRNFMDKCVNKVRSFIKKNDWQKKHIYIYFFKEPKKPWNFNGDKELVI